MFKREIKRPQKPMPEYQVFAPGFWYALLAVMSMILCAASVGVLISYFLEPYYTARTIGLIQLGFSWALAIIITHLNFMVSRGSAFCHILILWVNRGCLLILLLGNIVVLIAGDYITAAFSAAGLALGFLAHQVYLSEKYLKFVEYHEIIWAHHRWKRKK